jgi:hypothetical protein
MADQLPPRRLFALVSDDGFVMETAQDSVFFEYAEPGDRVFEYTVGKQIDLSTYDPEAN